MVKTCHDHGALATGGMAASLHQPGQLEQKIHDGKALEMSLGVDGFLIYDLKFLKCLQPLFGQEHQPVQDKYTDSDLLSIPKGKVTLKGLVKNIKVGILFISSWMVGKGSLISESLSLWLKSQKKVPKYSPEHYPPKEKMLWRVIWHPFLEICAKLKKFLTLGHL